MISKKGKLEIKESRAAFLLETVRLAVKNMCLEASSSRKGNAQIIRGTEMHAEDFSVQLTTRFEIHQRQDQEDVPAVIFGNQ